LSGETNVVSYEYKYDEIQRMGAAGDASEATNVTALENRATNESTLIDNLHFNGLLHPWQFDPSLSITTDTDNVKAVTGGGALVNTGYNLVDELSFSTDRQGILD
jgi:hypothetical protein